MAIFGKTTSFMVNSLPAWAVVVPIIGAFIVLALSNRSKIRDAVAVAASAITFAIVVAMYPLAIAGGRAINFNLSKIFFGIGMNFSVDAMSFLFAFITTFVWFLATLYSLNYMDHEEKHTRYYFFMLITLAANVGVLVTGDFFSLFIFFEGLGLFSYPLVIHSETKDALKAGTKYMLMNIIGGVALLAGILLLYFYGGSFKISGQLENLQHFQIMKYIVAGLLIGGFGVKAGFVPLHIWLPDAHPVAPSPASALLSGIMIKAGIYGIIRTVAVVFRPPILVVKGEALEAWEHLWSSTSHLGFYIIWIGIATMLIAAIMALLQDNGKRLLAYSSVSQMGYIVMGVGAGTFMAAEGSLGLSGALFHIFNHAMFKSAFFLVIGAVYYRTHELRLSQLGGLWKKMPLAAAVGIIAAGGIMGVPFFNGFASKSLLFEGIAEASKVSNLFSVKLAEYLYLLTSSLTTAYILKFVVSTFFGEMPEKYKKIKNTPLYINIALSSLGAVILMVGLFPNFALSRIVTPIVAYWQLPTRELAEMHFFTLNGFGEAAAVVGLGVLIFAGGTYYDWFTVRFPEWFSIDWWYQLVGRQVYVLSKILFQLNDALDQAISQIIPTALNFKRPLQRFNRYASRFIFAFFVDMWLFKPVTPSVAETEMALEAGSPEEIEVAGKEKKRLVEDIAKMGGRVGEAAQAVDYSFIDKIVNGVASISKYFSFFSQRLDVGVVDKIIGGVAFIGERLSYLAGLFDKYVIDGIVNGVAWLTKFSGKSLRPTQTGEVQNYGLVMLSGVFLIVFFFALAYYGIFTIK
jgi:formate hydrogenlyase subunit 3/multisubunit Na+/H+ antiporter MnhD subunit